jgi:iron complex outermembrane receptor protein
MIDYGATLAARYEINRRWAVRAAGGRRIRFPTMRELFGEALNRFLVNPDLQPESAWSGEVGLEHNGTSLSGELTAFFNRTFDTIDRRNVVVDGDRKRQRINLDGSRVAGVEAVGSARPTRGLRLDGHLTWMRTRTLNDGETLFFAERPEWIGTLTSTYRFRMGLSLVGQVVYTGTAYSLAEDNTFVKLPTSTVLNTRVGYRFRLGDAMPEVFARVDNLTDERVLTQLGLPGPGRELVAGLNLSL